MLCAKIAEHGCYIELVETILKGVTEISDAENPVANAWDQIYVINTMVKFITGKNIKPSCKKLSEDTLFTDFNMVLEDEATMNSARSTVESKRPSDELVNEWKEQHNATM